MSKIDKNEQKLLTPIFLSFLFIFLIFVIYLVFSGNLVLPQSFNFGPVAIHYYGLIMALAVAVGFYIAKRRAEKYQIASKAAEDIIFWIIIGGFLGARLYHVFSSYSYYYSHPLEIFKVWQGGLSIYGAIFGGLITLFLYKKVISYKLSDLGSTPSRDGSIISLLNWLTPSIIVGQIIGRFGNLFNYEAFGYPTNLPWKMFVPLDFRPLDYQTAAYFHPWFLYEQIGLLMVLMMVIGLEKTDKPNLFIWYLLLYNILRFGLEFLRADSPFIWGFRQNAAISLVIVLISFFFVLLNYQNNEKS